jgi:hypothetical protein
MPDLAPTVRAALDSPLRHKPSLLQSGIGAAPRCCSGSFAEQVAGDVQNGEAPTPFWERLQIGLDKNLDSLFAGKNLDANRRIAKFNLVASPIPSSNDSVGH